MRSIIVRYLIKVKRGKIKRHYGFTYKAIIICLSVELRAYI